MEEKQLLIQKASKYCNEQEVSNLLRAVALAEEAHTGVRRLDGTPYFEHSIDVASLLADWQAPSEILVAGVLHDLPYRKYSSIRSIGTIRELFGQSVARTVETTANLRERYPHEKRGDLQNSAAEFSEHLPWVTLVLRQTPMAALIRFANQICNYRSLSVVSSDEREIFATINLNLFVPLASRLGMQSVKRQLEDESFQILQPKKFNEIQQRYPREKREEAAVEMLSDARARLAAYELDALVEMAPVSQYWLYRRELELGKQLPLEMAQPYLVLVSSTQSCYQAIGAIHELWPPKPGEFIDYIASRRPNGYQALHTVVRNRPGQRVTFLIRSTQMNLVAEWGIGAEWLGVPTEFLPELPAWQEPPEGKIAVFTPLGDIKTLPVGATPIDFAYEIHRTMGHQVTGAIVNGRVARLDIELQTGDVVKLLTSRVRVSPDPEWLVSTKTSRAKREIRSALRVTDPVTLAQNGKVMIDAILQEHGASTDLPDINHRLERVAEKFGYQNREELLASIGSNAIAPETVFAQLKMRVQGNAVGPSRVRVISYEAQQLPTRVAKCCNPQAPDPIVGYEAKNRRCIMIHSVGCKNLADRKLLYDVEWTTGVARYQKRIDVLAKDRIGLVGEVGSLMAGAEIAMVSFHADSLVDGMATIEIGVGELSEQQLLRATEQIHAVKGVESVTTGYPALPSRFAPGAVVASLASNPYTLKPVSGEFFYGRKDDLRALVDKLRILRPSEAVLLWGARRIGKSSLLLEFKERILDPMDYLPIMIDMQKLSGSTTVRFLLDIMESIANQVAAPQLVNSPRLSRLRRQPMDFFRSFIEHALVRVRKHLVLMVDEFQLLSKLTEEDVSLLDINRYLRSLVQSGSGISFIFSGGGILEDLQEKASVLPLLEVAHQQRVLCLKREDARELIVKPFVLEFDNACVEELLDQTAGHPYYLQMLCGALFERAKTEMSSLIELRHLKAILSEWVPDQGNQFFSFLLGSDAGISKEVQLKHKLVMVSIAELADTTHWVPFDAIVRSGISQVMTEDVVSSMLNNLTHLDSLECKGDLYRFKVPVCEIWFRENHSIESVVRESRS